MKTTTAMLTLLVLAGCGAPTAVDGSLQEYVTDFEQQCGYTLQYLDYIKLSHLPENVAGWCSSIWTPNGYAGDYIEIDIDTWASLTETQRTALIFHEGLHCTRNTKDLYSPHDRLDFMYWASNGATDTEFWEAYPANHRKYCNRGNVINE